MARNEEKAQAMLNKWLSMKKDYAQGPGKERRPFLASDCDNLADAEKWRRQIIKEISRKVSEIQNAGLGEHRIRDLNDQINKSMREKSHWQRRIKELGGPDYNRMEPKVLDGDGREVPGGGGYRYFGAAKNLPGVKELFEASAYEAPRRTRGDMYKGIDPDYYGYRDEDDGILVKKEAEVEKRAIEEAVQEFQAKRQKILEEKRVAAQQLGQPFNEDEENDDDMDDEEAKLARTLEGAEGGGSGGAGDAFGSAATSAGVKAHVPVPSQEDIQQALMERKKAALLSKYLTSGGRGGGGPAASN